MHYHCEIVIPPTMDIEASIAQVMKPFNEQPEKEDEDYHARGAFWDWWVIGGRWAGHKLMARYDQAKLDEFYDWLNAEKVTVSGVQFGKRELNPADQIPKVDAKWNEMFPSAEFVPCPIFRHSNDQHGKGLSGTLPQDVIRLSDVPAALKCSRVIFARPAWNYSKNKPTGEIEAAFMLAEDAWNGVNHMKIDWDGTFAQAAEKYAENRKHLRDEYAARVTPASDWLVVTVDYHS